AHCVLGAEAQARLVSGHATLGRIRVEPNATNAIASRVTAWLDARAPNQSTLDSLGARIWISPAERAALDGTEVAMTPESASPGVEFDAELRDRIGATLDGPPMLPTGAGHD